MRQLRNKQRSLGFGGFRNESVSCYAVVVVVAEDGVPVGFNGIVADHHVACYYDAYVAFAPAAVEVGIGF